MADASHQPVEMMVKIVWSKLSWLERLLCTQEVIGSTPICSTKTLDFHFAQMRSEVA